MGALEDLAAAYTALAQQLAQLAAEISELRQKVQPQREIFTLRDLVELPESPSLKVLRNHPERQPNAGVADGFRAGQKAWLASSVLAWRRQLSPAPATFPHVVHREAS